MGNKAEELTATKYKDSPIQSETQLWWRTKGARLRKRGKNEFVWISNVYCLGPMQIN
jgi:hypothetical protein